VTVQKSDVAFFTIIPSLLYIVTSLLFTYALLDLRQMISVNSLVEKTMYSASIRLTSSAAPQVVSFCFMRSFPSNPRTVAVWKVWRISYKDGSIWSHLNLSVICWW
jgi:hypothetical protein